MSNALLLYLASISVKINVILGGFTAVYLIVLWVSKLYSDNEPMNVNFPTYKLFRTWLIVAWIFAAFLPNKNDLNFMQNTCTNIVVGERK